MVNGLLPTSVVVDLFDADETFLMDDWYCGRLAYRSVRIIYKVTLVPGYDHRICVHQYL